MEIETVVATHTVSTFDVVFFIDYLRWFVSLSLSLSLFQIRSKTKQKKVKCVNQKLQKHLNTIDVFLSIRKFQSFFFVSS